MSAAICVRGLTKRYGDGPAAFTALRGVDLDVAAGELVMLSGPSGSGKTTLLSIVGCTLAPTTGSVRLFGQEVAGLAERELARIRLGLLGFVFQAHNLVPALDAQDNVALVLELRGLGRAAAREEAARQLDAVGLASKLRSRPPDLSGGQRQRVAIARALAGSPPMLLADEPTASLDAESGLAVSTTLRDLARRHGHTVVVVTHDTRIFHLADRIVRIEDGQLQQEARS